MRRNGRRGFIAALIVALLLVVIPSWAVSRPITTTEITLSPSGTVDLTVGEKATVRAAVIPEDSTQPVEWISSDRKVAIVTDGVVSAKGKGAATITARSGDREAAVEVRVVPREVSTTGIAVSPSGTVKLTVGDTAAVMATLEPWDSTQPVEWSSSDEAVAIVRKGIVEAKGRGKAVIMARSGDHTATVEVRVVPRTVRTTKIRLSPSKTVKLRVGDKTTLEATVEPADSTQSVKWSSSDEKVATVDSKGVVTAQGRGTAKITASSGDKSASVKVKVSKAARKKKATN